jgi:hypothetical protein
MILEAHGEPQHRSKIIIEMFYPTIIHLSKTHPRPKLVRALQALVSVHRVECQGVSRDQAPEVCSQMLK